MTYNYAEQIRVCCEVTYISLEVMMVETLPSLEIIKIMDSPTTADGVVNEPTLSSWTVFIQGSSSWFPSPSELRSFAQLVVERNAGTHMPLHSIQARASARDLLHSKENVIAAKLRGADYCKKKSISALKHFTIHEEVCNVPLPAVICHKSSPPLSGITIKHP